MSLLNLYYLSYVLIVIAYPISATDWLDVESEGSGMLDGSTEVCYSLLVQILFLNL
jgi:hypothetical protein